jgi:DNA-binding MarR family transcriptional regulator
MPHDLPHATAVVDAGPIAIPDGDLITGWGLVVEGYARVTAAMRRDLVDHCRLEPSEFEVLLRLSRSPEHRQTASQLAAEVSFSSGGFTKLADRLERAGLVRRMPCQNDRRVVWIGLTPVGQETIAAATGRHVEFLRRYVLDPLGVERFTAMSEAMRALRDETGPN